MDGIMQMKKSFPKKKIAVVKDLWMHSNHKLIEIQAQNESKVFCEALISIRSWDFTEALGLNMHMRFKLVCCCINAARASKNMLAQIWDNYMGGIVVLFCFVFTVHTKLSVF